MWNNQIVPRQVFPKSWRSSRPYIFLIILIFSTCFFSLNAQAGEVTLAWDPPSSEYEGFILSYGTVSGSYSDNQDVGTQTTHTVSNLKAGQTYFFSVKAYKTNPNIESPYSNQVSITVPATDTTAPASPERVQIVSGG